MFYLNIEILQRQLFLINTTDYNIHFKMQNIKYNCFVNTLINIYVYH